MIGFKSECVECGTKIYVPFHESIKNGCNAAICEDCSKDKYECEDGYSFECIEDTDANGDTILRHITIDANVWVCKEI